MVERGNEDKGGGVGCGDGCCGGGIDWISRGGSVVGCDDEVVVGGVGGDRAWSCVGDVSERYLGGRATRVV